MADMIEHHPLPFFGNNQHEIIGAIKRGKFEGTCNVALLSEYRKTLTNALLTDDARHLATAQAVAALAHAQQVPADAEELVENRYCLRMAALRTDYTLASNV